MKNKVNIEKIIDELQMRFNYMTSYYNTKSGEILNVSDDDIMYAESENFEDIINREPDWYKEHLKEVYNLLYNEEENYIRLPNNYEIRDKDIMFSFIDALKNEHHKQELYNCLNRKGMYRLFKNKLYDLGIEDEYYKFYDKELKKIALEWCKENNLEIEG